MISLSLAPPVVQYILRQHEADQSWSCCDTTSPFPCCSFGNRSKIGVDRRTISLQPAGLSSWRTGCYKDWIQCAFLITSPSSLIPRLTPLVHHEDSLGKLILQLDCKDRCSPSLCINHRHRITVVEGAHCPLKHKSNANGHKRTSSSVTQKALGLSGSLSVIYSYSLSVSFHHDAGRVQSNALEQMYCCAGCRCMWHINVFVHYLLAMWSFCNSYEWIWGCCSVSVGDYLSCSVLILGQRKHNLLINPLLILASSM